MASPMSMGEAYDRGLLQSGFKFLRVDKDKEGYLVKYDNGYQSGLQRMFLIIAIRLLILL